MDYELRRLRQNAITSNTLGAWQAYAHLLERSLGTPGAVQRSIVCYNIEWDVHDADLSEDETAIAANSLPNVVVFHTSDEELLDEIDDYDLAGELSDQFGFAVSAFVADLTSCIDIDKL